MENTVENKCANAKLHPDYLPELLIQQLDEKSWHTVIFSADICFSGHHG